MLSLRKSLPLLLTPLLIASPLHAIEIPGAAALADLISGHFDNNSDGILDVTEWQSGMEYGFGEMDADFNGRLTSGEVDGLSPPLSRELGEAAAGIVSPIISKVVFSVDANDDGEVSEQEFLDSSNRIFDKLDADENKEISTAELKQLPLRLLP